MIIRYNDMHKISLWWKNEIKDEERGVDKKANSDFKMAIIGAPVGGGSVG